MAGRSEAAEAALAPLIHSAEPERPILWTGGRALSVREFLERVRRVAAALQESERIADGGCRGDGRPLINLCEHRDRFLIAYCAALACGRTTLLPPSRAPLVIEEVAARHAGSQRCDDEWVDRALAAPMRGGGQPDGADARRQLGPGLRGRPAPAADRHAWSASGPQVARSHVAEIAFTSGSTGAPTAHVKRWGSLLGSTAFNAERIRECLAPRHGAARPWIVATVPPQHMYGTETSILLPLAGDMAVHAARPLFPADVADALAEVPVPRVLVATPVHLRALVASGQRFPDTGVILSATAPLDRVLAAAVERTFGAPLLEMFGSTETCVIATRRTAADEAWRLYPGVSLAPTRDGTAVEAPWFDASTRLQDVIDLLGADRFIVRGRNADVIEVAGKRGSLADLTRRLLGIEGVRDAVVFQPAEGAPAEVAVARMAGDARGSAAAAATDAGGAAGDARAASEPAGVVHRVAAFVVAPGLTAETIAAELAQAIDPAFLPRPLVLVPSLPRNEVGKLTRDALMRLAAEQLPSGG